MFDDLDPLFEVVKIPDDAEDLAEKYEKIPLVELWIKAVRAAAYQRMDMGQDLPGFKMVEGRKGNRKFVNRKSTVKFLQSLRLSKDKIFEFSLRTPTQIKKHMSDRQFERMEKLGLISQADGKPTIAKESDRRIALLREDVFEDLTGDLI